jgi:hypothetical protein
METKFKLKEVNGENVLIKINDKKETIAVCPYSSPIAVPGQLQGQIQLIPRVCGNNCPLFEIIENIAYLHCNTLAYQIEKETNLIL